MESNQVQRELQIQLENQIVDSMTIRILLETHRPLSRISISLESDQFVD